MPIIVSKRLRNSGHQVDLQIRKEVNGVHEKTNVNGDRGWGPTTLLVHRLLMVPF